MAGHLYSSLDMKRFVSAFWADKKLTVIGTGAAVSGTPHSAALCVLLRTKKPGSDMVMEKEPCRESSLHWPFLFLSGTRGVQAAAFWMG